MRVAVVDIGTNSTRLLVADVDGEAVTELERRSQVTRLGQGVDGSGRLADEAMERVFTTLAAYREAIDGYGAQTVVAVLTSAVRDASNGAAFTATVAERFDLDARTIEGEEEAELTFLGATSERTREEAGPLLVVDIGGGSTELVVGVRGRPDFYVSARAGVVRQTERHIASDPPAPEELQGLAAEVGAVVRDAVPVDVRAGAKTAIAVAGTATSLAAIDQALEPYDPARVHGYWLEASECELLLARLAAMTVAERREVAGLHPDRAPTIVAGVVILLEVLRAFGLERVEVSEHDLLRGVALRRAGPAL